MKRTTEKISVSFQKDVLRKATERAKQLGFINSFSAYLQKLVSDDLGIEKQNAGKS